MLKMAKEAEIKLDDEPRNVRDPVMYNRLRVMIEEEAIKDTWGCPLYVAARRGGWLTEEHRRAGDKYQQITLDHKQAQESDPEELPPEMRELAYKRIERRKAAWKECVKTLGRGRQAVDRLVLEETNLPFADRAIAKDGLQLLANLFNTGNKS